MRYFHYQRHEASSPSVPLFQAVTQAADALNAVANAVAASTSRINSLATVLPVTAGTVGDKAELLVDSVQLHSALGVETRHNDWVARRLSQHPCTESVDYIQIFDRSNLSNQTSGRGGARRSIRYALTLRLAKLIAMSEHTPAGDAVRSYFLECERLALETSAKRAFSDDELLAKFDDSEFLLRLVARKTQELVALKSQNQALETKIELDAPKVTSYHDLIDARGSMLVREAAKEIGTGQDRLYDWMRRPEIGIIIPDTLEPYQRWIDAGYFLRVPTSYTVHDEKRLSHTTRVTAKGLIWLQRRWKAAHAPEGAA